MCGTLGALLYLYCGSGCDASSVASALAFHPPDPFYYFTKNRTTDRYDLRFKDQGGENSYRTAQFADNDNIVTPYLIEPENGGSIPILFFKCPQSKYTVLYSHGNATDIGAMYLLYRYLCISMEVNVVAYDYSGYGASNFTGLPTERQVYQDIENVFQWCVEQNIVSNPEFELIVYGQSVGSGPSCYIASKHRVAGLIVHSGFMSGLRVLTSSRSLSCWDIFPNMERIATVKCPVMIIHGMNDFEIPIHHGQGLLNAVSPEFRTQPWWVPGRGHNDVLRDNELEYLRRLEMFLEAVKRNIDFTIAHRKKNTIPVDHAPTMFQRLISSLNKSASVVSLVRGASMRSVGHTEDLSSHHRGARESSNLSFQSISTLPHAHGSGKSDGDDSDSPQKEFRRASFEGSVVGTEVEGGDDDDESVFANRRLRIHGQYAVVSPHEKYLYSEGENERREGVRKPSSTPPLPHIQSGDSMDDMKEKHSSLHLSSVSQDEMGDMNTATAASPPSFCEPSHALPKVRRGSGGNGNFLRNSMEGVTLHPFSNHWIDPHPFHSHAPIAPSSVPSPNENEESHTNSSHQGKNTSSQSNFDSSTMITNPTSSNSKRVDQNSKRLENSNNIDQSERNNSGSNGSGGNENSSRSVSSRSSANGKTSTSSSFSISSNAEANDSFVYASKASSAKEKGFQSSLSSSSCLYNSDSAKSSIAPPSSSPEESCSFAFAPVAAGASPPAASLLNRKGSAESEVSPLERRINSAIRNVSENEETALPIDRRLFSLNSEAGMIHLSSKSLSSSRVQSKYGDSDDSATGRINSSPSFSPTGSGKEHRSSIVLCDLTEDSPRLHEVMNR